MKDEQRFSAQAAHYEDGRPSYPEAVIEMIYKQLYISSEMVLADIGAGTGKLTQQLLQQGSKVYAVEPNDRMREILQSNLTHFAALKIFDGTAEATTLPDDSIDILFVAQAFHWFEVEQFKRECHRVLRPGGKVVLIWNWRDEQANINKDSAKLFQTYCPEFYGFSGGVIAGQQIIEPFFAHPPLRRSFSYPLLLTRSQFLKRSFSSSYSLQPGDQDFDAYEDHLYALFDHYAVNDILEIPNECVVFIGMPAG